jgi:proline iminopeptidase
MKDLYPPIEPYAAHFLDVDGGHRLYAEECGNPAGLPVVFLHGGPGSGCKSYHRCFFDPHKYRIVLPDQRGSGRSTPHGGLTHNTTQYLLADLELIRTRLGIDRWLLFGGSWGAGLALLYAEQHPERVSGMVLRGTFLARHCDLNWYVKDGVNRIYPERWAELVGVIPKSGRGDLVRAIHGLLHGKDELAQRRIARAWSLWGGQVALGDEFDPATVDEHVPQRMVQQARLELHYAFNRYFLEEGQILEDCERLPDVPIILIHGRRDLVCPVESAYALHQHLPRAELRILPNAGHIASGEEMIDALVRAADEMAERLAG